MEKTFGSVSNSDSLSLVGWREWVSLPQLGVPRIKCKVDTGARTSALHAFRVEPFEENRQERVRFFLHPLQRRADVVTECVADVLAMRTVSDSGGHRERRIVIRTPVVLGLQRWEAEFALTDRDTMRFRMLLGRTAIEGRFLVDSSISYAMGRPPTSKRPARRRGDISYRAFRGQHPTGGAACRGFPG
ncbi:MAG: ATP-dependent zinc protease [Pseudomonadota bacterium]|nr:MAG: ATP-dependent zinc protease [Pseudomonadota bacterium]